MRRHDEKQMRREAETMAGVFAEMLMNVSEAVKPLHEWLTGQHAYFQSQGYSDDQARALAAATYVTVFGTSIGPPSGPNNPDKPDGP